MAGMRGIARHLGKYGAVWCTNEHDQASKRRRRDGSTGNRIESDRFHSAVA
jgi:hypothetical protein